VPVDRGQFAEPLALVREVSRLSRETGDRMSEAWGRCIEGEILYLSGELDAGQDALRASAEAMVDMSDFRTASYGAGRLAESYLKQGRIDEAEALLKQHHGNMEDRGISGFTGRYVMTGLALAALMRAEQAEDAERRAALDEAERACDAVLRHGECDALALVLGYRLRGTHEWLRGPRGRAEHWWQKSLDLADKLGARYEGALTHLEIGRRLGNRDELERAEAEFAEMGAGFDLAEARRLLGQELDPSAPREETGTTAESTPPKLAPDAG
jgi:ATP/maltotriose-dependent transcriptional regulator MalT